MAESWNSRLSPRSDRLAHYNGSRAEIQLPIKGYLHCHDRHRAADHRYEGSEDGENPSERGASAVLTLPDFIYSTYNSLLEGGWRMREIDEMDMLGFLKIRAWNARKEQRKKEPKRAYIDKDWLNFK